MANEGQMLVDEMAKLNISAIIELYELDLTPVGEPTTIRFHNGTNERNDPIVFQGLSYNPLPIRVTGFGFNSDGAPPRPSLSLANLGGWLSTLLGTTKDLVGAKLTRRRTFSRFLDGQPDAAPVEFPLDIFFVSRKTHEDRTFVELELVSSLDLDGVFFPRRGVQANYCPWKYRGNGCTFSGDLVVADDHNLPFVGGRGFRKEWSATETYLLQADGVAQSVQRFHAGFKRVFNCLIASPGVKGVDHTPGINTASWLEVQRFRGEYNMLTDDYVKNDVVWIALPDGIRAYAIVSYANGAIPIRTDPLNSTYWRVDWCAKTMVACQYRFDPLDAGWPLNFGGFPGTVNLPSL